MNPFHFGASDARLLGVYHPAAGPRADEGVVLCPAARDEYYLTHRAFRQLATRLARAGRPVLRFDYYGTGDSYGESDEGTVERWRADVALAVDELKDMSGVGKVSLIGLRLGATLSALVGCEREDVERVVLWDPIVLGSRYLERLRARHERFLIDRLKRNGSELADRDGWMGFPLTGEARAELAALDLKALDGYPQNRVFIVVCERSSHCEELVRQLRGRGTEVIYEHVPGWRIWEKDVLWSRELVPARAIRRITSWLED